MVNASRRDVHQSGSRVRVGDCFGDQIDQFGARSGSADANTVRLAGAGRADRAGQEGGERETEIAGRAGTKVVLDPALRGKEQATGVAEAVEQEPGGIHEEARRRVAVEQVVVGAKDVASD